ncbi:MAG: C_GCAxxG_C_C family protein [Anaerolineae bacterium]|nr:C_GCAxxG_C_C family protein [Anaerolineae bacterium]
MLSGPQSVPNLTVAACLEAGQEAVNLREQGYHCSESVFLAVNNAFRIVDPSWVRLITGFHGGGGTHRLVPGVNLTELLSQKAPGYEHATPDELPVERVGHLCGALAAGMACLGLLYGRRSPTDDLTCVDELCFELHRRFLEKFHYRECHLIREHFVPNTRSQDCETVYRQAAELIVQLILEAHALVPECPPCSLLQR